MGHIITHTNERIVGYYIVEEVRKCSCGTIHRMTQGQLYVQTDRATYPLDTIIERYKKLLPGVDRNTIMNIYLPTFNVELRQVKSMCNTCTTCAPMFLGSSEGYPNLPVELHEQAGPVYGGNTPDPEEVMKAQRDAQLKAKAKAKARGKSRLTKREDPESKRKRQVLAAIEKGSIDALLEF